MNLKQVYVQGPEITLPRPSKVFVCADYELICLGYEEALSRGWDGQYGDAPDGSSYFLEVLDCSLDEFCKILITAEGHKQSAPVSSTLQGSFNLWGAP